MPRPARPWFRFYVEALHDRKLRRLTPAQRWLWVAILGAARQSPIGGFLLISERESMDATDLADIAGMSVRDVEKAIPLFDRAGLIEWDPDIAAWCVPKWQHRQYESDNTTERTRKHRSKQPTTNDEPPSLERSNDNETEAVGTPPDTEAEKLTPQPHAERGASAHTGQHPNCRACGTNRRTTPPPNPPPDPLAEQRQAQRSRAEAGVAAVVALRTLDPDPDPSGSARAAARDALDHPHQREQA